MYGGYKLNYTEKYPIVYLLQSCLHSPYISRCNDLTGFQFRYGLLLLLWDIAFVYFKVMLRLSFSIDELIY